MKRGPYSLPLSIELEGAGRAPKDVYQCPRVASVYVDRPEIGVRYDPPVTRFAGGHEVRFHRVAR